MSKSNATEIIAILYLIAALLARGWLRWTLVSLAFVNILESIGWSIYEHRKKAANTTEGKDEHRT